MKDPNQLLNIEKAIKEKFGEKTIQNPKSNWDIEKEKDYLLQLKEMSRKEISSDKQEETIELNGVLLSKKLFNKENDKICIICKKYSFKKNDDVYLSKYNTCFKCFIEKIEGREEKWKANLQKNKLNS